ncbi:lantibiotic dehydratase [Mucilaginibacter ginsenosidivorax]|uniref:Lantibiotic dehydratase N-terminal domain-containing protein n=1 Tax=Mucilaginibacter ginsenosidivorax TaxID=862126 RepID=A0A5B8W6H2_9SPHI|nr:lantibiotic dehydratase [Mucilaginibacter ginsenosidivorax]QEC78525.1 hypothetical protein FSB76_22190 [Mucilaginibacter ginsenosidivorax]
MNYYFSNTLILRMPVKTSKAYHSNAVTAMLADPFFRAALYIASPVLYYSLSQSGFNGNDLNEKEKFTILKYFNRLCFRPTPFGLFCSVSLIKWGNETKLEFDPTKQFNIAIKPDQAYAARLGTALLATLPEQRNFLVANPTIYRAMDEYRFIRTVVDQDYINREYLLQSTDFSRLLKDILFFCQTGKTIQEIIAIIINGAGCSIEEARDYVEFLKDSQLLLQVQRANIAGKDHLKNLIAALKTSGPAPSGTSALTGALKIPDNLPEISEVPFKEMNRGLRALLPRNAGLTKQQHLNVILTRPVKRGKLTMDLQAGIADGLFALDALCPVERIPEMERFIKEFKYHFEGREIPLMTALDPELGIGYQQESEKGNPLLETLHIHPRSTDEQMISWSPAHESFFSWL